MARLVNDDSDGESDAPEYPFRSTHTLAWVATVGLILHVANAAVNATLGFASLIWVEDWEQKALAGDAASALFMAALASASMAAAAVAALSAVTFLVWLHRASRNAWALYPEGVRSSPAMAVGCWFIPFVNLVRPYHVVKALYSAAATDTEALRGDWVRRVGGIFPIWWGTWLVSNALSNLSARRVASTDPEKYEVVTWLQIMALPLEIVAAACLLAIIWSIQARQEDIARRAAQPAPFRLFPDDPADDWEDEGDDREIARSRPSP